MTLAAAASVHSSLESGRRVHSGRATLRFLGAADTVTDTRYLIETGDVRVLVDCGCRPTYACPSTSSAFR